MKLSHHAKAPRETRRQRINTEIKNEKINEENEQVEMAALRDGYAQFYGNPGDVSCLGSCAAEGPINKTGLALAIVLIANACKPSLLFSAYCKQTGTRFPILPTTTEDLKLTAPIKSRNNDTAAVTPSNIPTLADIGNGLLECGKYVYDSLPALPKGGIQGVGASVPEHNRERYWHVADQEPKPTPKTFWAALTADAETTSLNTSAAIFSGINAYHHWLPNVPQDERLKGLALEYTRNNIVDVKQLLVAFAPLMPREWGKEVTVDQYEYAILKYATQLQRAPDGSRVWLSDIVQPQTVRPQTELKEAATKLFFNALAEINETLGARTLRDFIHSIVDWDLHANPTLDKLPKLATQIRGLVLRRLALPGLSLTATERHRLDTLVNWFTEATLVDMDPLLSAELNIQHPDFGQTSYHSRDGTLMSIGAGFIHQFPAKTSHPLTPAVLREVGLHSLINLSPQAWPSTTGAALIRFYNSLPANTPGELLKSPAERMKAGLSSLMAPVLTKIRLLQEVKIKENAFLLCAAERFNNDTFHEQQSRSALNELELSKFHLYKFGIEHLPQTDQENLIRSSSEGRLEVFVPEVILYKAEDDNASYKATLTATSGFIVGTGSTHSTGSSEYYLFSEERSWSSPVVSRITKQIAGDVTRYVNDHHATFTSGVRFQPSSQISFETSSIFTFGTNPDEIAIALSGLYNFPPSIHKRFIDASAEKPPSTTVTGNLHSTIYAFGKFLIGMIPEGSCVIAVLDTAEMIALPANTDEGLAEQGMAIGTDALFCFTGMVRAEQASYLIPSVRPPFNFRTSDEFAESKITTHLAKQAPETGSKVDLKQERRKLAASTHMAMKPKDLQFRTGISEFIDTTPAKIVTLPNKISVRGNTLRVPRNLAPKGLIQKSEGGPIYIVMGLANSEKKVSYLWNEPKQILELQTDQWLKSYEHLLDQDPQVLSTFMRKFPQPSSSADVAGMLYNNKRLNSVRQIKYQSFFDHPPVQAKHGIYSVGDREYIKLEGGFYLLEEQSEPSGERRIKGEGILGKGIPEDLRLDMKYDGANWYVTNNHLITPMSELPKTITSFNAAIEQGFNLPEGWSTSTMYVDHFNRDQFIFSFHDKEGRIQYRSGPDRNDALEELTTEKFDEKQCRVKRAPPVSLQASCSSPAAYISPLPSESMRRQAINELVALDIETRPFYERPLLRLEILRDAEKIQNVFHTNPELELHFSTIALLIRRERSTWLRIMSQMKTLQWGTDTVPAKSLLRLSNFWKGVQDHLKRASFEDFGGQESALNDICETNLKLCESQRSYIELKEVYLKKVVTLNRLSNEYKTDFLIPQQKATTRLWKVVIGPVLTTKFTKAEDWTFEIHARGISEIRKAYGQNFADNVLSAYATNHEHAENLVDWSKDAPESFWKDASAFFHVIPEDITLAYKKEMIGVLSNFRNHAAPASADNLRIVSPAISPEGVQYRYNLQNHVKGAPQESSLFGNEITAYTFEENWEGGQRGEVFLTTSAFLSPINSPMTLEEVLGHELAHLAIPEGQQEIYLSADQSKFGHCSEDGMRRHADAILGSPAAFLSYIKNPPDMKLGFLTHFRTVLPSRFKEHFPQGIKGAINQERFDGFVTKLFEGPPDEKIKAFMMPDIFVSWLQHMLKTLPTGDAQPSNFRHKRESSPNPLDAQIQKLLVRELFDASRRKKNT
ncbi:hypothetical protein ACXX82_01705 [Glaciimonas sp. GNP009]